MSMYFYVNSNAQPNGDHEVHRSVSVPRGRLLMLPGSIIAR